MTAGLVGAYNKDNDFCFLKYADADGGVHPSISHFPFIVLKADNSNQIRTLRNQLIEQNLPFNDFTSTMTVGTSEEQQVATRNTPEAELDYFGVCTFADTDTLKTLTKKFQLFR
jgi:6-phosphogluconate dehydrogenase